MQDRKKKGLGSTNYKTRNNGPNNSQIHNYKHRSQNHKSKSLTDQQLRYLDELQQQISQCQNNSQNLYSKLQHMQLQYQQSYEQYNNLIEPHSQDIQDEIERIEGSIDFLSSQIVKMRTQVQNNLTQRTTTQQSIRKLQKKREQLLQTLSQQKNQLQVILEGNLGIQEDIRATRENYQVLQEEVFQLDALAQNVKKYGSQLVPSNILKMIQTKEPLSEQLCQLNIRISMQQKTLKKLIPQQKYQKMLQQLRVCRVKNSNIQQILKENQQLGRQKQKLNKIKAQIEWNPSLQIKQLEANRQQEQAKIATVQKQIAGIKKKTSQIYQKKEQYRYFIRHRNSPQSDTSLNIQPRKTTKTTRKQKQTKNINRHLLYEQIKNDLEQHKSHKKSGFSMLLDMFSLQKKAANQPERVILSEKTYKINSGHSMFFILMIWGFLAGLVYYCYTHTYRR